MKAAWSSRIDPACSDRVSRLRDHGRSPANHRYFVTDEIGFKYRMSSLAAAFGRAQLSRIDELVNKKKQIFRWYEARLGDVPEIRLNVEPAGVANTFWMVTVVVDRSYGLSDTADDGVARPRGDRYPPLPASAQFIERILGL